MNAVPAGWKVAALSEIATLGSGGTPQAKNPAYYGGDIPWAIIGDLNDDVVHETQQMITPRGLNSSSAKIVPAGTVLLAMYGSIGKLGITAVPMASNQAIATIQPSAEIDGRYLFYYLLSQRRELDRQGKGATQRNISQTILRPWLVRFPTSTEEQRSIVDLLEDHLSRLDAADRYLAIASARIERLSGSIVASALDACSHVPRRALGDLVAPGRRLAYGVLQPGQHEVDGIPLVRVGDLGDLTQVGSASTLKHISPQIDARFPRTRLVGGEVLLSVVGTIGRVAVAPTWLAGANVARAVAVWPTSEALRPDFAALALRDPRTQQRLLAAAHEVARKTLNLEDVRDIAIPVPTLSEQEQVVATAAEGLDAVERLNGELNAARNRQSRLRRSLLTAAFSGRLTGAASEVPTKPALEELQSV